MNQSVFSRQKQRSFFGCEMNAVITVYPCLSLTKVGTLAVETLGRAAVFCGSKHKVQHFAGK